MKKIIVLLISVLLIMLVGCKKEQATLERCYDSDVDDMFFEYNVDTREYIVKVENREFKSKLAKVIPSNDNEINVVEYSDGSFDILIYIDMGE